MKLGNVLKPMVAVTGVTIGFMEGLFLAVAESLGPECEVVAHKSIDRGYHIVQPPERQRPEQPEVRRPLMPPIDLNNEEWEDEDA